MPMIEVLVGMVASGKSTYARKRADEGALVVDHDRLCAMVHSDPGGKGYEDGLRECYRRMQNALVREILSAGRDALVDRTHLTRESRERWIRLARSFGVPIVAVVFPIEAAHIHAERRTRAGARGRPFDEWLTVAEHHAAQAAAEPISIEEGFAEIRHVARVDERGLRRGTLTGAIEAIREAGAKDWDKIGDITGYLRD